MPLEGLLVLPHFWRKQTVLTSPFTPPKVQLFLYQELLSAKGKGAAWLLSKTKSSQGEARYFQAVLPRVPAL